MQYTIRKASSTDAGIIKAMLPRLANFEIPPVRTPEQLWQGDRDLVESWEKGERECLVYLATQGNDGDVLGAFIVTLREEVLNHEPSAHLEVLVVAEAAEGRGIGNALLQQAQIASKEAGAQSMSLHVFASNTRARAVYEKQDFDGELLRYYKPL